MLMRYWTRQMALQKKATNKNKNKKNSMVETKPSTTIKMIHLKPLQITSLKTMEK